jgi:hypothetical protein
VKTLLPGLYVHNVAKPTHNLYAPLFQIRVNGAWQFVAAIQSYTYCFASKVLEDYSFRLDDAIECSTIRQVDVLQVRQQPQSAGVSQPDHTPAFKSHQVEQRFDTSQTYNVGSRNIEVRQGRQSQ